MEQSVMQVTIKDMGITISLRELIQFAVDEKHMAGADTASAYRNLSGTMSKGEWNELMKMDVAIRFAERFVDRFAELPRRWNSIDIAPPFEVHHKDGSKETLPKLVKARRDDGTMVYAISTYRDGSWLCGFGKVVEWGEIIDRP